MIVWVTKFVIDNNCSINVHEAVDGEYYWLLMQ
jgi:hypothetical protein